MAKDKEFNEVGEDQDIIIEADYNPLNEGCKRKSHTQSLMLQIDQKIWQVIYQSLHLCRRRRLPE